VLPLSVGGEIVCHTCHDNHNTSKFGKMLRVDFIRLCVSCHVGY
jgi:predicted CXXCH cytochrome family protein